MQRLDPVTKRPSGPVAEVYHSQSARRSLLNAGILDQELAAGGDRLVFTQGEVTGNVWLARPLSTGTPSPPPDSGQTGSHRR